MRWLLAALLCLSSAAFAGDFDGPGQRGKAGQALWSNRPGQTIGSYYTGHREVSGTTDKLTASDCGSVVWYTGSSAVTVTTFTPASPCNIGLIQWGTGQITVSPAPASAHSYTKSYGQPSGFSLVYNPNLPTPVWVFVGDGA